MEINMQTGMIAQAQSAAGEINNPSGPNHEKSSSWFANLSTKCISAASLATLCAGLSSTEVSASDPVTAFSTLRRDPTTSLIDTNSFKIPEKKLVPIFGNPSNWGVFPMPVSLTGAEATLHSVTIPLNLERIEQEVGFNWSCHVYRIGVYSTNLTSTGMYDPSNSSTAKYLSEDLEPGKTIGGITLEGIPLSGQNYNAPGLNAFKFSGEGFNSWKLSPGDQIVFYYAKNLAFSASQITCAPQLLVTTDVTPGIETSTFVGSGDPPRVLSLSLINAQNIIGEVNVVYSDVPQLVRPSLSTKFESTGAGIVQVLTWGDLSGNFYLESAESPSGAWTNVTGTPTYDGEKYEYREAIAGGNKFFRLRCATEVAARCWLNRGASRKQIPISDLACHFTLETVRSTSNSTKTRPCRL